MRAARPGPRYGLRASSGHFFLSFFFCFLSFFLLMRPPGPLDGAASWHRPTHRRPASSLLSPPGAGRPTAAVRGSATLPTSSVERQVTVCTPSPLTGTLVPRLQLAAASTGALTLFDESSFPHDVIGFSLRGHREKQKGDGPGKAAELREAA